jgi:hypothetical protein
MGPVVCGLTAGGASSVGQSPTEPRFLADCKGSKHRAHEAACGRPAVGARLRCPTEESTNPDTEFGDPLEGGLGSGQRPQGVFTSCHAARRRSQLSPSPQPSRRQNAALTQRRALDTEGSQMR